MRIPVRGDIAVGFDSVAIIANGYVELGESEKALEWIDKALAIDPDDAAILYNAACVYSQLGEFDTAFDLLDKSVDAGFQHKSWLLNDQDLLPLKDDPRFTKIVDKLG